MLDNISEQGDGKNIPLSRENKIYLYLKNNNKNDNSNVIILDNNT
jgi:pyrimidine operon attenuation protein/uracil phosphoribosyltransferase